MPEYRSRIGAFMDMGASSVRLMIARSSPDRTCTILSRQKEMIRLGAGDFPDGGLKVEAIARAVPVGLIIGHESFQNSVSLDKAVPSMLHFTLWREG